MFYAYYSDRGHRPCVFVFVSVIAIWLASCSAAVSITRSFTRSLSLESPPLACCSVLYPPSLPVRVLIIGFGSGLVLAGSQVVRLPLLSTRLRTHHCCRVHPTNTRVSHPVLPVFSFCSRPSCSFSVSLLPDSCYAYPYLARTGSVRLRFTRKAGLNCPGCWADAKVSFICLPRY